MQISRRNFLQTALGVGAASAFSFPLFDVPQALADEAKKIVAQAMGSDDKKRARRARLTAFFAGAAAALAVFAVVLLIVR